MFMGPLRDTKARPWQGRAGSCLQPRLSVHWNVYRSALLGEQKQVAKSTNHPYCKRKGPIALSPCLTHQCDVSTLLLSMVWIALPAIHITDNRGVGTSHSCVLLNFTLLQKPPTLLIENAYYWFVWLPPLLVCPFRLYHSQQLVLPPPPFLPSQSPLVTLPCFPCLYLSFTGVEHAWC
jgi:hypothetical protein